MSIGALFSRTKQIQQAYERVFSGKDAEIVLADLMGQCKPNETTFVLGHPDASAFNEGMRALWVYIQKYINMTDEELRIMADNYAKQEAAAYAEANAESGDDFR